MQGPSKVITHDQAVVKRDSEQMFPQSTTKEFSFKLNIDGGLYMNIKKMQFSSEKFSIGFAVSLLKTMSALP